MKHPMKLPLKRPNETPTETAMELPDSYAPLGLQKAGDRLAWLVS
jgi:hypothetical protein